jgi:hypothetical protein
MVSSGCVLLALLVSQVPAPHDNGETGRRLRADFRAILEREAASLAKAAESQPQAKADAIRALIVTPGPPDGPLAFVPLPESTGAEGLANRPASSVLELAAVHDAREAAAKSMMRLAHQAAQVANSRYDIAALCLRGVLARDRNHPEARRLLGYLPHDGGWATPQAAENLKGGLVLDPTFGWVPDDWIPHLNDGLLPGIITRGRPVPWLPADQANALRDSIQHGWVIKTEHFEIQTDVPLADAIQFGRRLEALHDAFFLNFGSLVGDSLPLARRFADPSRAPSTRDDGKRHSVWYFASKNEYVQYLRPFEGADIANTLGTYLPARKGQSQSAGRSYFFRDENGEIDSLSTLFHEASHQLLFESLTPATRQEQNVGNYWVWEGLGTYFETFTPQKDGSYRLGGLVGPRIAKARENILIDGLFIPISELTAMDKSRFRLDRDVAIYYAESMALTVFFLNYDNGRYRDEFLDYVSDAYKGRYRRGSSLPPLVKRLGVAPKTLEGEFLDFLRGGEPTVK